MLTSIWETWLLKGRIIAFDLDETLIDTKGKLYPGVLEGLIRLKSLGIRMLLNTGRTPIELAHAQLPDALFECIDDRVICNDGNVIYHRQTKACTVLRHLAPEEIQQAVPALLAKSCSVLFEQSGRLFASDREAQLKGSMLFRVPRSSIACVNVETFVPTAVTHLYVFSRDASDRDALREFVMPGAERQESQYLNMMKFYPADSCKSNGLLFVLQSDGLTLDDVMAVGNGENDRSVMSKCGYGVAVQGSVESLCVVADVHLQVGLGEFLHAVPMTMGERGTL